MQTLQLIAKIRKLRTKKFYNIGPSYGYQKYFMLKEFMLKFVLLIVVMLSVVAPGVGVYTKVPGTEMIKTPEERKKFYLISHTISPRVSHATSRNGEQLCDDKLIHRDK